ncbi:HET-domain-containing protein [Hypoxylon sp. FL1857]|nr:HET-domain-containing protein [Hypoxylon sp. FL1857]
MARKPCRALKEGYRQTLTSRFTNPTRRRHARTDAVTGTYKYRPLRNPRGCIRLLYLFPRSLSRASQERSILSCMLLNYRIDKAPPYTALSYTWGDATLCRQINVGGKLLHITKNLAVALRHLQEKNKTIVLWVDAVCINQQDEAEKGPQVQMMGKTYMQASVVLVWLGPSKDGSDEIMHWIRHSKLKQKDLKDLAKLSPSERLRTLPEAMAVFLARPWFSRVWVTQEVALNKNVIFVCGRKDVWKNAFLTRILVAADILHSTGNETFPFHFGRFQNHRPFGLKEYTTASPVARSLLYAKFLHASEPKDFVYSLLGMISDSEQYQVIVDYTKSVEEVYTNFTAALIKAGGFWYVSKVIRPSLTYPKLPSWVPDWSATLVNWTGDHHYRIPDSKAEVCEIDEGGHLLRLSALGVDGIESVEYSHLDNDLSATMSLENICQFLPKLATTLTRFPGADGRDKVDRTVFRMTMKVPRKRAYKSTSKRGELYRSYLATRGLARAPESIEDPETWQAEKSREYISFLESAYVQNIFVTSEGAVGLASGNVQPGDSLFLLSDLECLWALREVRPGQYRIVCPASTNPSTDLTEKDHPIATIEIC